MSRAAGLCKLCGGPKRGRAARDSTPSVTCGSCGSNVCHRHGFFTDSAWWCIRCAKTAGIKRPPP